MMEREEIVKALRCCGSQPDRRDCEEKCPYFCGIDMSRCIPNMISDAITLLKADTDEIAALKAENERLRWNSVSQDVYQMMCEERDAAVADMKTMALAMRESEEMQENCCFACKFANTNNDNMEPWDECPGFGVDKCFEWRGPQKGKE